jgi:hypothetical protein
MSKLLKFIETAGPLEGKFTRKDLDRLMAKIKTSWAEPYRLAAKHKNALANL